MDSFPSNGGRVEAREDKDIKDSAFEIPLFDTLLYWRYCCLLLLSLNVSSGLEGLPIAPLSCLTEGK